MLSPFLWHKEEDPWIVENEVLIANIQMSGKVSTVCSQGNCHKDREEATPFMVFGKLSKWESCVRKQMFNVCELSQEIFLLPNLQLCSSTCEMYSTLQWCCSTHRDEGKIFFFLPVLGLFCYVVFCLFETREGYSLEREAQLLIVVASFVVKHRP